VDFHEAVIAVGFAGQQAFQLQLGGLVAQSAQRGFGLIDDVVIALGLAELDHFEVFGGVLFKVTKSVQGRFKPGAFAHDRLGVGRVLPEFGIFGERVQFRQAGFGNIDVKDASSAAAGTARFRREGIEFRHAWGTRFWLLV